MNLKISASVLFAIQYIEKLVLTKVYLRTKSTWVNHL